MVTANTGIELQDNDLPIPTTTTIYLYTVSPEMRNRL